MFASHNLLVIAGATVRLDPLVAEKTEGRYVELCAVVESAGTGCRIEYDFNITFYIGGTAGISVFLLFSTLFMIIVHMCVSPMLRNQSPYHCITNHPITCSHQYKLCVC